MYAINQRVNQVFFGILVLDEQLKQNILSLARQNKQTRLIQLLQKEYELKLTLGK